MNDINIVVPDPVVHIGHEHILTPQGHFQMSCVIEIHSTVDTPVSIEAVWSGNPSLTDSQRVTIVPPTLVPYTASVIFASLVSTDFGDYELAVKINPENGCNVYGSSQSYTLYLLTSRFKACKIILYVVIIIIILDSQTSL